ncbi:MAG: DUF1501 domain-containing protein [Bacteroidales bacterium]|nr:DUF1501 domain-containing protein [Bacteroidales bacterium]
MLNLTTGHTGDCSRTSRRTFLQVGGLATLGLGLPQYLQARSLSKTPARAKRCILLWMQGGPSHIDMFDPKPDAPAEIRGEFETIPTSLTGIRFTEHVPQLAKLAHKFNLIRGHDPKNGSHGAADALMLSGHKFNATLPYPTYGSVIAKERGFVNGMIPYVQLGRFIDRRFNGGIAGILGDEFNPFEVHEDPSRENFKVRDLALATEKDRQRLDRRYSMLSDLEAYQKGVEESAVSVRARDTFYEKAHDIITSPAAKKAFDIAAEDEKTRARYGKTQLGQNCLLSRRLIEAGVQFVTVTDGGWDTHENNFKSLKERNLPRLDSGLSALIADLDEKGLLDETLVVWFGDFGRTPKVNPSAGRDHWSTAGVAILAGGGLKQGEVVGRTNDLAEYVTDSPVTPADLAATIYTALGVPLNTWFRAPDGRPIELCPEGIPVRQLF